ncbi:MAG: hypothetical protein K8F28_01410, partial [Ignavibacteriaceae bacterium]|nr:hypothetical protein [Ignavibacteriaceae bacterium]
YSNFLHEKNLAKESNDVLALLHHLIEQVFSLKSRTNLKITIFFNLPLEIYQKLSEFYFKDRIYNKSNFVFENGEYGLTSFKITTNEKKTFVVPKSSFVQSFNYTDFGTAINLSIFEYILRMKEPKIPNPLPLFIFQDQLNSKVINTVRNTGYTSLREVFIELNDDHVRDLGNYYLLYWGKGKSIEVSDIDYVEKFRYKLENVNIYHLLQNKGDRTSISDIFEFESNVVNPLFFNLLITEKKKPSFHYFDDVDKFYSNKPHKIVANLKNYRYSFYEYIYKSKSEAISESLVLNIAISNVIDIIHSSKKLECQSYDWIAIQNILNILFSINQLFDKTNKNFGGRNMPSEIPKYFTQLNELVNDPDKNLEDDYHYAFCAGQLIYYLLAQSQSGEKKHSLVEPFINRTSVQAFNEQLIRVFNQYKHAISFNFRRFNRLFEQVIGYKPETSYKELSSAFFAGYFGENIFFQKQTDSTEGDLQ